jgi:hypothetical protein
MDHFPEFALPTIGTDFALRTIRDIQFGLFCYEVLSFFFLTLVWFDCLGSFITSIIAVLTSKTVLICFATGQIRDIQFGLFCYEVLSFFFSLCFGFIV